MHAKPDRQANACKARQARHTGKGMRGLKVASFLAASRGEKPIAITSKAI